MIVRFFKNLLKKFTGKKKGKKKGKRRKREKEGQDFRFYLAIPYNSYNMESHGTNRWNPIMQSASSATAGRSCSSVRVPAVRVGLFYAKNAKNKNKRRLSLSSQHHHTHTHTHTHALILSLFLLIHSHTFYHTSHTTITSLPLHTFSILCHCQC